MKTLLRDHQLKYIEGMRVVINNRCIAEQIKSDKVESVVMGGSKIGESVEKLAKYKNLKCMNVAQIGEFGKVGKLESSKTDEERKDQNDCKLIIKSLARRNREKHAILPEMEGEEQDVKCFDDITGKELPWHAVRKAREQELKYLT